MRNIAYEFGMMGLALIVVMITIIQITVPVSQELNEILCTVDFIIWIIFVIDYIIRLVRSPIKWQFIKENKIDLITIIPFSSLFRLFRILKITRVVKLAKLSKLIKIARASIFFANFTKKANKFLKTNNFHVVLGGVIIIIFIGAGLIFLVEEMNFSDAIWWSLVTTTTVGYGDISPETGAGRIVASVLMLTGIGFLGMLTGTISTYFISPRSEKNSYHKQLIDDIKIRLDNFENLTVEDINQIHQTMLSIKQTQIKSQD